jgi:hypothetical protein
VKCAEEPETISHREILVFVKVPGKVFVLLENCVILFNIEWGSVVLEPENGTHLAGGYKGN